MKHDLKISLARGPQTGGLMRCRSMTMRGRLLDLLFGRKERLMILVPGDTIDTVSITEIPEGGYST